MKSIIYLSLGAITLLLLTACKPDPFPKNPNYAIQKPLVKYEPSKKNLD